MNPSPSAVLFDLDGTLLDTLEDIAALGNRVLDQMGYPTFSSEEYKAFIGNGLKIFFQRALPEADANDEEILTTCMNNFELESKHKREEQTRLFHGIAEMLDGLKAQGFRLAILSNKPHDLTVRCCEQYLAQWSFEVIFGQRENVPPKPDPHSALEITSMMKLEPERFLYLGDTAVDMETARSTGMVPVGVKWGFRPEMELKEAQAAYLLDHPLDLLKLV